jgi:hypothetical protein
LFFFKKILTGGNKNRLYGYSFDNKLKREIITTPSSVYDISINYASKSNKVNKIYILFYLKMNNLLLVSYIINSNSIVSLIRFLFQVDISLKKSILFFKVMCIAGSGCNIDLCINFSYKSLSLKF